MKKGIKKILFLSITFLFLFSFSLNVNASVIENDFTRNIVVAAGDNCPALGDPTNSQYPAYWLQEILNIMRYVAIVALLVLVTTDFVKAVARNDKDALKRFIYCVILFFVPIIVNFIMNLFGVYGSCGIG